LSFIRLLVDRKVVLTFTPIETNRPLSGREPQLLNATARDAYLRKRAAARTANVPATTLDPSLTTLQGQLTRHSRVLVGSSCSVPILVAVTSSGWPASAITTQ
jgi:hypothetical protein